MHPMNRFVIVDGLPYLLAGDGKTYAVCWDELGFTVGAEVKLASPPTETYSELSILAKCAGRLDSISAKKTGRPRRKTAKEVDADDSDG